ncbi:hypothetical protein GC174_08730 [bacterium]|nr:hypothetical protein [bacterium]
MFEQTPSNSALLTVLSKLPGTLGESILNATIKASRAEWIRKRERFGDQSPRLVPVLHKLGKLELAKKRPRRSSARVFFKESAKLACFDEDLWSYEADSLLELCRLNLFDEKRSLAAEMCYAAYEATLRGPDLSRDKAVLFAQLAGFTWLVERLPNSRELKRLSDYCMGLCLEQEIALEVLMRP